MLTDMAISGVEGWLILIAPYVCIALVWFLIQSVGAESRSRRARLADRDNQTSAAGQFGSEPAVNESEMSLNAFRTPFPFTGGPQSPSYPDSTRRRAPEDEVRDVDVAESEAGSVDPDAVAAEIKEALQAKDQAALGQLYLRQGIMLQKNGDARRAGDVIRKSVMIAMQLKDARLHAVGRLELGDICAELGDLTTACEHWQMAKRMFLDMKHRGDSETADQRMLGHGCPTEWVLTDF